MENRHILGIGSADCADRAQFPYTISRAEGGDAVGTSVPVGRIRCIQLVAASYPFDTGTIYDGVINGKSKVPGDPKYLGNAEVLKPQQNVFYDGEPEAPFFWDLIFGVFLRLTPILWLKWIQATYLTCLECWVHFLKSFPYETRSSWHSCYVPYSRSAVHWHATSLPSL
jgi:hypothetical protein